MSTQSPRRPLALAIHGGAGVIDTATLGDAAAQRIHADLDRALDAGHAVLASGGSALDAVEAAVCVLEDAPHFNAGHGAVFTADGRHELDASIMDGQHRRAGAVAGIAGVRNPVRLARRVLEDSPHVFLIGAGAEQFADLHPDIERVPNDWFSTEVRRLQLVEAQRQEQQAWEASQDLRGRYFGTVGAVALDSRGHLAAATSTGGMTNKRWGRVGDSPLIGAGTWADAHCAVSCTGWGEYYIRNVVAHDIAARVRYRGDRLRDAAEDVVLGEVPAHGGDGGVIALDRDGNVVLVLSTRGMYRGWIRPDGSRGTAIHRDD
ncbi:isoaspartyl peptidase/L-asparaginase [Pseudoxanthomonas sp. Root630]|uniref:isoaspartyl peptidase/L-asparaginase family protein n=1 Tax=Pseudoxanthomonas sp. Root630 TaxID=1736574 RepID=UPI000702429F|nr:isoaspartyl peptidase/L-asparaginase [Pseudoxanthomonas sp. Root630]KRA46829.1 asparaginase [Pseudoxanthomonas sp. Root630]